MLYERMKAIAGEYGYSFRTSDDGKTHMMECLFGDGRSQVVGGTELETREGPAHAIFTVVGPASDELDYPELLARHLTWPGARIGVLGEDLVVAILLDPEQVGDELEDELFGVDES